MSKTDQLVEVKCRFKFSIYPRKFFNNGTNGREQWMVISAIEEDTNREFRATGTNLPTHQDLLMTLRGHWEDDKRYGKTFRAAYSEIAAQKGKKAFVSYITSLRVGIASKRANAIYDRFGDGVWDILDRDPKQLTAISGVTDKTVKSLEKKLQTTRVERELNRLLDGSVTLTRRRLDTLIDRFGDQVLDIIRTTPFKLCEVSGFSFRIVDRVRHSLGIPYNDPDRLVSALIYALDEAAARGHTCVPKEELLSHTIEMLNVENEGILTEEEMKAAMNNACKEGVVKASSGMIYKTVRYNQEKAVTDRIMNFLMYKDAEVRGLDPLIDDFEQETGMKLAEKQRSAVKSIFSNHINIITGGPGTGKTTVIKAVLSIHEKVYGEDSAPVLLSPTGRAARRMTEATGFPAQTIHSAVNYRGETSDEDPEEMDAEISGNLFIIDECSMMDLYITSVLLRKLPDDARVVFVGDPDQLPSVSYGNVLYELLRSGIVPTTKLDVIFRQGEDSPIIANAEKIRKGETDLLVAPEAKGFCVFKEDDAASVFNKACSLYIKSVQKYGIENVILINPYREKSDLNVGVFNRNLQHILNPPKEDEYTIKKDSKTVFRAGDRVMQMKNTAEAQNGDTGKILRIERIIDPNDPSEYAYQAIICWNDDGDEVAYSADDMKDVDLAYCTTVHKSQGSEYSTVILVMSEIHWVMLRRNLIYTAVTRAKNNVAIVTERECHTTKWRSLPQGTTAIELAIWNNKTDARYSLLADRIVSEYQKRTS